MTDPLLDEVVAAIKRMSALTADLAIDVRELREEVRLLREVRQPPPPARPGTLTINQASERLSCSRSKIYILIRRGQIKITVVGKRKLITERELERFIDRNTPRK